MPKFIVLVVLALFAYATADMIVCDGPTEHIDDSWVSMEENCLNATQTQIQMEVNASYVYMAMASYFSQDTVNMPGFAKLFFEHASEERSHAQALIDYLMMRGPKIKTKSQVGALLKTPVVEQRFMTWDSGLAALKAALAKEKEVTNSIRELIAVCDKAADYHLSDHLTGEFLEEQYRGMRDLAGKISTLSKMMTNSERLGQFLFDKEL